MKIEELTITNFRNISNLKINPHTNFNIVIGDNGQGKSNLLEAISCLSLGKSMKTNTDRHLLKKDEDLFYLKIKALIENNKELTVEMGYDKANKKVKVNGLVQRKLVEFIGNLKVTYFIPEDLSLVKDSPTVRRKFLDTMLCQISNRYCIYLLHYKKILEQRNKVLKDKPNKYNDILDVLDTQIIEYGTYLWRLRYNAVLKLKELCPIFFAEITEGNNSIEVSYKTSLKDLTEWSEEDIFSRYSTLLRENRLIDLERGYSTIGPHRDDIVINIDGMDSKHFASQGQQRLIALSLKMSEFKIMKEATEETPILLLDDILSELDEKKIRKLLEFLSQNNLQVFITTAVDIPLEGLSYKEWKMSKGTLVSQYEGG